MSQGRLQDHSARGTNTSKRRTEKVSGLVPGCPVATGFEQDYISSAALEASAGEWIAEMQGVLSVGVEHPLLGYSLVEGVPQQWLLELLETPVTKNHTFGGMILSSGSSQGPNGPLDGGANGG